MLRQTADPMTLEPFHAAPIFVKAHILAALVVLVLMPAQFFVSRKGSAAHRVTGYIWMMAMLVVAMSSFAISSTFRPNIAGFGPIHALSVFAIYSVGMAIRHARRGEIKEHRGYLIGLSLGFLAAGAFTILPSRIMGQMLFDA